MTLIAVLVRTLREGKTYNDFIAAWYPDKGFNVGGRGPFVGVGLLNEREIVSVAFFEPTGDESFEDFMERIAAQEAVRHERIDEVIESTELRGLYEQRDEFDFSTDETVRRGRP